MPDFELAHLNIATLRESLQSPAMADFTARLERINALADSSAGFVWRWQEDQEPAQPNPLGELTLINISVWRDVAALRAFVYRSAHAQVMARRQDWFERMSQPFVVLWWIPRGCRPTVAEALARLATLRESGPTPAAFTFAQAHPPPDGRRTAPIAESAGAAGHIGETLP